MKKCTFCGQENNDNNNYCINCGRSLNEVAMNKEESSKAKVTLNSNATISKKTNKFIYEGKWFKITYLIFALIFSITLFASVFSVWSLDFFSHYGFGSISILNAFSSFGNGEYREPILVITEVICLITLFALLCVSFVGIIFSTIDLAKMRVSTRGQFILIAEIVISFILLYVYSLNGIGALFINIELVLILMSYFAHIIISRVINYSKEKYELLNDGALLSTFIAFSLITEMIYVTRDYQSSYENYVYTSSIFGFIYLFDIQNFFLIYFPILIVMIMSLVSVFLIFKHKYLLNSIIGYIATFVAILAIFSTNSSGFEIAPIISFIVFNLIQSSLTLIYYFIEKEKKA